VSVLGKDSASDPQPTEPPASLNDKSNFSQNLNFASSQQKKARFYFIEAENGSPRNKNEKTHQKAEI
jgi:hypothetical protein